MDRGLEKMMDSNMWLKFRPRKEKYLAVERELDNAAWPMKDSFEQSAVTHSDVASKIS